ncbi:MAG: hypothetical protein ABSC29_00310 [Minisyncoccia bacterium]|jgi:hypothetical protein
MASFQILWEAPEYEYREKTVSWYWLSIIIAAIVIAFSVWEKNFLFGLFVVVAEMLFIVWGNREPRTLRFALTENDIEVEKGKAYPLKDFENVGIDPLGNGWAELVFTFRAKLKIPFKILFPEDRLTELRNHLKTVLKEVPYEPTLIDSIEKLLRF